VGGGLGLLHGVLNAGPFLLPHEDLGGFGGADLVGGTLDGSLASGVGGSVAGGTRLLWAHG
jgi:hypothetical protein